jgi:hypothetical protein
VARVTVPVMEMTAARVAAMRRYHVQITVQRSGWLDPDPAVYAARAQQAAAARRPVDGVISAHTAAEVITVVTVDAPDQASAVSCGLAVVAEALGEDPGGAQVSVRDSWPSS